MSNETLKTIVGCVVLALALAMLSWVNESDDNQRNYKKLDVPASVRVGGGKTELDVARERELLRIRMREVTND